LSDPIGLALTHATGCNAVFLQVAATRDEETNIENSCWINFPGLIGMEYLDDDASMMMKNVIQDLVPGRILFMCLEKPKCRLRKRIKHCFSAVADIARCE